MDVLLNSKKINTKYWIVFAVEPFKKRCDNFDAKFINRFSQITNRLLNQIILAKEGPQPHTLTLIFIPSSLHK